MKRHQATLATAAFALALSPLHAGADALRPLTGTDFLHDGAPPAALVELGRLLFFDPVLSGNRNISCGTCHDPRHATGDGRALSIGEGGEGFGPERTAGAGVLGRTPRNAQPLFNIGAREYASMFHDGRLQPDTAQTFRSGFWSPAREDLPPGLDSLLAAQAMFPVISAIEMAGRKGENAVATAAAEDRLDGAGGAWDLLAARLRAIPGYSTRFADAFADVVRPADIQFVHAANALAAFQAVAFRSHDSPFDAYLAGRPGAMSRVETEGMRLFYGDAGCVRCHSGPLLTDHGFHAIAMPQIGPGKGHGRDGSYWRASGFMERVEDEGRFRVSFDPADRFRFRTPSLRNVALTGPWGHAGSYDRLEDVVRHHLDPLSALERYSSSSGRRLLPPLRRVIHGVGSGSRLVFQPLNPARKAAFDARDVHVVSTRALRNRIAAANELPPLSLSDEEVSALVGFLGALTSPGADDLSHLIPAEVPSGLPPQPTPAEAGTL